MKRTHIMAAIGAAILGLTAAPATAQVAADNAFPTPSGISVRLGIGYPINKDTRDIMKTALIGVGLDYYLPRSLLAGGETTLSFDWLGKSASGAKGNLFPIFVNQRFYSNGMGFGKDAVYFQVGLGAVVADVFNTETLMAVKAGAGIVLGQNIYAEGNFIISDTKSGTSGTSIAGYIGYRF